MQSHGIGVALCDRRDVAIKFGNALIQGADVMPQPIEQMAEAIAQAVVGVLQPTQDRAAQRQQLLGGDQSILGGQAPDRAPQGREVWAGQGAIQKMHVDSTGVEGATWFAAMVALVVAVADKVDAWRRRRAERTLLRALIAPEVILVQTHLVDLSK